MVKFIVAKVYLGQDCLNPLLFRLIGYLLILSINRLNFHFFVKIQLNYMHFVFNIFYRFSAKLFL